MNQYQNQSKMDKFFEDAEATLKSVKAAANVFKWLASIVIVLIMTFAVDTRIRVETKADKSLVDECYVNTTKTLKELENSFLSKKDALTIHNLEFQYYTDILSKDSSVVKNARYPETINRLLQ